MNFVLNKILLELLKLKNLRKLIIHTKGFYETLLK